MSDHENRDDETPAIGETSEDHRRQIEELTERNTGGTALFVRRPVLALVFNALIIVAGLAAYFGVEVRELPGVDRPVISVSTDYEGASPETIDREITETIEGAVSRVAGVKSISSSSEFGDSRVTIEFNDDVDMIEAASDVRDAVGRVMRALPDGVDEPRIVKADADAQAIMRLAITSDRMSIEDLTVLVEDEVSDRLAAVPGVADVQIYGDQAKIFQVDIDQTKLASRGLTVGDVANALSTIAFDVPAGALESDSQNLLVRASAEVTTPEDFEAIFIEDRVRLGDVATVTLDADDASTMLRINGVSGIGLGIVRQAQSNTLEISEGVHQVVGELRDNVLPEGAEIRVTSDDATFVRGAVHEVIITLVMAVLIVVVMIYLFLRDWRATLIPAMTLPGALIGTLAAIYLAGFSINILTLLAIVIATGLVVDDAIIVLENIVRRRGQGLGARAAAVVGTREVFFAVIATTATLAAVFVPLSFLPGQTGGLFREFGFVLAFAVLLSSVVALTLTPMMASRLLKGHEENVDHGILGRVGDIASRFYSRTLKMALDAPAIVLLVSALIAGAAYVALGNVQQELTPQEDRSMAMMRVSLPEGVSLDYTRQQVIKVEEQLLPMVENGEIRSIFTVSGNWSINSAFMVMTLAPWDERERLQAEIIADINEAAAKVPAVRAFAIQPNSLGIRGAGQGLRFAFVGNDYDDLGAAAQEMVTALENDQRFTGTRLSYETTQPQLDLTIDRDRASDLGIDIDGLGTAIQAMLDGSDIGDVFIRGRAYPVELISTTDPVNDPTDLQNIFVRTGDGRNVPISTIATVVERPVAPELNREQQLRSVEITTDMAPGFALGDAYAAVEQIAQPLLPPGARVIPMAEAATLEENASGVLVTFAFAMLIIFLVLSAQFESFVSSVIVMATVPLGLACAVFALILTGGSLNVYSQIGLVLLVGIMAKNGILIVEFANQLRDRGHDVRTAVEEAANIRLRPVMMTMIATILGGVPLVFSQGAGAEARNALGWIIVGGLGLAVAATLYLTPVAYLLLARFSKPKASEEARLMRELDDAATTLGAR